jgi:opacity protein-like surface antigen
MRFTLLAALSLLLALSARAADFVAPPPHPIARFADFEVFGGELTSPRLKAGYRFYVDPARAALFTVMPTACGRARSRRCPRRGSCGTSSRANGPRLRCFEWVDAGGGGAWREISHGGAARESELVTLRRVLAEQNRDYRRQVPQAVRR